MSDIRVNADTLRVATVSPTKLEFGQEEHGTTYSVKVRNTSDNPLSLNLIDGPPDIFDVEYPSKPIKPGKTEDIKITLKKDTEAPIAKKSYTFEFDDPLKTRFTIPVHLLRENKQAMTPTSSH